MLKSLHARIFLALLLVAVLSIALVALLAGLGTFEQFNRYITIQDRQEQQTIATIIEQQLRSEGLENIEPLAGTLQEAYGQEIALVGPEGELLYSSSRDVTIVEEQIIVGDEGQEKVSKVLELKYENDGQEARVTIPDNNLSIGSTTTQPVTNSGNSGEQNFFGSINRMLLVTIVAAVILAGMMSVLLARRIIRPIKALTDAAGRLEAGDLSRRVQVSGTDEIGQLAGAFNAMAGSLQRQESVRRQMVTDIAHELRTPLSNLYGYLEAIEEGIVSLIPTRSIR